MTAGPRVAGLLLAAGAGRRYGRPKALVEYDGQVLVERAYRTLRAGGCEPALVVLGAAATEVTARADLSGAVLLTNPDWPSGMGSSLRVGLAALDEAGGAGPGAVTSVVVLLVDTPGVTAAAVRRVAAHAGPAALAVATYHGAPGHPVLLGRDHWRSVSATAIGDIGARRYLAGHPDRVTRVSCEDIADGTDVDLPAAPPGGC